MEIPVKILTECIFTKEGNDYYDNTNETYYTKAELFKIASPAPDDPKSKAFIESLKPEPKMYSVGMFFKYRLSSPITQIRFSSDGRLFLAEIDCCQHPFWEHRYIDARNPLAITEAQFAYFCGGLPENFEQVKPTGWEKVE